MSKIKFNSLFWLLVIVLVFIPCRYGKKQQGKSLIIEIEDFKELKKIIRTKTNLLLIFSKTEKSVNNVRSLFEEVAVEMKGKATLALVDCSESKKICKNMKVSPTPLELKHYKDGNFNKDYDRKMVKRSMVNFLLDPTGDIPWEEETTAADVIHIDSATAFYKFLKKEKLPVLVMFYAPWCGFCKRLKPDFAAAATEVKGTAVLVGVDVDKPHQMKLREDFNITGFPTIYYFENGKKVFQYGGENNKDGIISWLKDPKAPEEKKPEPEWADEETDVVHLKDDTFDDYIQQNPSVMVMFYAPWCGHCKAMKPDYAKVASRLKEENIEGMLAAVDATKEKKIGQRFEIKGFPSVKYFKNGEFAWDFNERTEEKIYEHMKDPSEPPPPPAPEPKWEETESEVVHLTDENFKGTLKKRKHALVMFYAPWCGHCKKAKPEYMQAAEKFKDDSKVVFAAIDCTSHQTVCTSHEVTGYPTFKYFKYGKNPQNYMGGREEADFINFMKDPQNPRAEPTPPPPETPEKQWAEVTGAENVHLLGANNFDDFMKQHKSVLVMFYAPWCGHCKAMKPAYGEAAQLLKEQGERGVLAAIDATQESALASKFSIKGYPTLKYFKNGEEAFEYSKGRKTEDLVDFMKNPVAPPPTPEEPAWSDEPSSVLHLSASNFEAALKERSVGLVMFYAPWCGHCKNAKPSFTKAAATISKMGPKNVLAAVDCTKNKDLCSKEEVKGFPTFKLYINGVFLSNYDGGREEKDFVSFVENAPSVKDEL